jgi:hypothetical protein
MELAVLFSIKYAIYICKPIVNRLMVYLSMKFVYIITILFNVSIFGQERCPTDVFDFGVITNAFQNSFAASMNARLEEIDCVELAVNETRDINFNRTNSPSGMVHRYALKRTGENSYESSINIILKPETTANPQITDEETVAMRERISNCLEEMSTNLIGPNGETLTIKIDSSAPPSYVNVSRDPIRANSRRYPLNIPCSTFLHEVLHLHGLADEYNERITSLEFNEDDNKTEYVEDNNGTAYNCRHEGLSDSIMSNQNSTVRNLQSMSVIEHRSCTRAKSTSSGQVSSECPKGFQLIIRREEVKNYQGEEGSNSTNSDVMLPSGGRIVVVEQKPASRTSLLEPAHFNAIINPGCSKNNLYYMCSMNAYQTSVAYSPSGGNGCSHVGGIDMNVSAEDVSQSCLPTPDLCRDPGVWLSGQTL